MTDAYSSASDSNRIANLIRLGTVAEVQPGSPSKVRVEIEDEWTSDFLPTLQLGAGRVRTWSAPKVGEQVILLAPSGEMTAAVAVRGLAYGEFQTSTDSEEMTVLAEWADGSRDFYDEQGGVRHIDLADDGMLAVSIGGALMLSIQQDRISLKVGSTELAITDGAILLKADKVDLGGEGGLPIARNTDPVAANKVVATSTKVKAV